MPDICRDMLGNRSFFPLSMTFPRGVLLLSTNENIYKPAEKCPLTILAFPTVSQLPLNAAGKVSSTLQGLKYPVGTGQRICKRISVLPCIK
jgi:hypothetical protein